METIKGEGSDEFTPETRTQVVLRTAQTFIVYIDDVIIGPNSSEDRYLKFIIEKGQNFKLTTVGFWNYQLDILPEKDDYNSGITATNVEEEPLTQYDMMVEKYNEILRNFAQQHNLDLPDEEDFEEDEDNESPLSHHEVSLMTEEYLAERENNSSDSELVQQPEGVSLQDEQEQTSQNQPE